MGDMEVMFTADDINEVKAAETAARPRTGDEFAAIRESQTLYRATVEDGKFKPSKPPEQKAPYIVRASDLEKKDIPPIEYVVEGLLPEGLSQLAGPPKSYKSYMGLQSAVCVAQGLPFLGRETRQGPVIYFDLESTERRPKERLEQIGLGFPDDLLIVPAGPSIGLLGAGFEETLANMVVEYKPVLIIIDVIQGIRPPMKRTQSGYDRDYEDYKRLRDFAAASHAAILTVNHMVKMRQADIFNQVSGSVGTFGALDALFALEREDRESREATLHVQGRDLEPQQLAIEWRDFKWTYKGTAEEQALQREIKDYENSPVTITVRKLVKRTGEWSGTAGELIRASKYISQIYDDDKRVGRMIRANEHLFKLQDGIGVSYPRSGSRREIRFYSLNQNNNVTNVIND